MDEAEHLIKLQTWFSPAFPTGAFSYSHGLEAAIYAAHVIDKRTLASWLTDLIHSGPGWNDLVLLTAAWGASRERDALADLAILCKAMTFSRERHLETVAQGQAFAAAAKPWLGALALPYHCPLPIVVGALTGNTSIRVEHVCTAYLHAYVSNQIQAALRLMRLGQQSGVELLADLESTMLAVAHGASRSSLDDLGSNCFNGDIASMQHEILKTRIFLS